MKEGRKMECPEQPPDNKLQKMPHTELGSSRGGKWSVHSNPLTTSCRKCHILNWEVQGEENGVSRATP